MSDKVKPTTETTVKPTADQAASAAAEKADRAAADKQFAETKAAYLVDIVATFATTEKDRSKGLLSLSRKMADFTDSALRHASEKDKARTLTRAVSEIETALKVHTEKTVGVSRLLGVYGFAVILDDKETVEKVSVSLFKVLLPLISRDATDPGLKYVWKNDSVMESGRKLVQACSRGEHTVKSAAEARDAILSPVSTTTSAATTPPADADDESPETTGTKSPSQKAAQKIGAAIKALGDDSAARSLTVKRLVRTESIGAGELIAGLQELAKGKRIDELKRVLTAGKILLERLASPKPALATA